MTQETKDAPTVTGECRSCKRGFEPERRGFHAPKNWIALSGRVEKSWPRVYDALLCRTCLNRVKAGTLDAAQFGLKVTR